MTFTAATFFQSRRAKQYDDMLAACRNQSTEWLERCAAEPSEGMMRNPVVRLAVRNALRGRTVPYVEVDRETAYGATMRLSRSVRVF